MATSSVAGAMSKVARKNTSALLFRPAAAPVTPHVQHGFAKLVAEVVTSGVPAASTTTPKTKLTHLSHQSPTRLLPLTSSSVISSGAAICAMSNYGGGMVQGDINRISLHVKGHGAKLGVTAQGANRIYKNTTTKNNYRKIKESSDDGSAKKNNDGKMNTTSTLLLENNVCQTVIDASVDANALLVMAPDPNVLFSQSRYQQDTNLYLDNAETSSLIAIDWFSAGRVTNGEVWNYDSFQSTTKVYVGAGTKNGNASPVLIDRVKPSTASNNFWGNTHAHCSVILAGPQSAPVVRQLQDWSVQLAAGLTSVRRPTYHTIDDDDDDDSDVLGSKRYEEIPALSCLGRTAYCGVTAIPITASSDDDNDAVDTIIYVARIAAHSNEDIYRILNDALQPLAKDFGLPFYKDRITSSVTLNAALPATSPSIAPVTSSTANKKEGEDLLDLNPLSPFNVTSTDEGSALMMNPAHYWSCMMLVDSGLPTGSFAHSSGLEVALQFGLLQSEADVESFCQAATRSSLSLVSPFVAASHDIVFKNAVNYEYDVDLIASLWQELDAKHHALLVSNGPACRASIDQGHGLLRVALAWSKKNSKDNSTSPHMHSTLLKLQHTMMLAAKSSNDHKCGHLAPLFGIITGLLGIPQAAAHQLLAYTMARDVLSAAVRLNAIGPLASVAVLHRCLPPQTGTDHDETSASMMCIDDAASTAPFLDALHPSHDLLAVRLFRT